MAIYESIYDSLGLGLGFQEIVNRLFGLLIIITICIQLGRMMAKNTNWRKTLRVVSIEFLLFITFNIGYGIYYVATVFGWVVTGVVGFGIVVVLICMFAGDFDGKSSAYTISNKPSSNQSQTISISVGLSKSQSNKEGYGSDIYNEK